MSVRLPTHGGDDRQRERDRAKQRLPPSTACVNFTQETVDESATTRMETFSDGVFAIAATLLVLEISVDTAAPTTSARALLHLWPSYLAYVTSFITIGIIWMNHHTASRRWPVSTGRSSSSTCCCC